MRDFLLPAGHTCSTDDVLSREQFEYWNDMVCNEFVQLDCTSEQSGRFRGKIRGCSVENLQISEVAADPQRVLRSKAQIAKATESEFLLSLQLEDIGIVNQDGRVAELQPGDFALYDSTRPYHLHFARPFRQIVLQIPYDSLADRFLHPQHITARRISAQSGVGSLTSQFIKSAAAHIDTLSSQDRKVVTEHVIELVCLAFGSMSSLPELNGQSSAREALFKRIKQYIEINIRNPELSPAQIAAHHRISERYQRMLFASAGKTVTGYIVERRLELCKASLEDKQLADHNVSQLAFSYGFSDAAYFSRKFKEYSGFAPKEYRETFSVRMSHIGRGGNRPVTDRSPD